MGTTTEVFKRGESNMAWFSQNFKEIKDEYGGQFIAVEDGEIIAHSPNGDKVAEVVQNKAEHPESTVIKFVSESGKKILR